MREWKGLDYLLREAVLILVWAYLILVAGSVTGLINFRLQATSAALAGVAIGSWLVVRLVRRQQIPRSGMEWGWLALIGGQIVATVFSEDVRRSLPVLAQTTIYGLVFYWVFDLARSGRPAELFGKTLLVVGGMVVALAAVELWQVYSGWRAMTAGMEYAPAFAYRLYAVFGDANLSAAFLNVILPPAAALFLVSRRRLPKIVLGLLVVGAAAIEWFNSSRGGLLGAAAAMLVLMAAWLGWVSPDARERTWRIWRQARARPWLLAGGAPIASALIAIATNYLLSFSGDATHMPLLHSRSGFWQAAWHAVVASPVWGSGPGTYPTALMWNTSMPPSRPYLHAHSVPITIAAEQGVVGLVGMTVFVASLVIGLWQVRRAPDFESRARWAGVAAASAGFAVHSLSDDFTRFLAVTVPLAVMVAAVLGEGMSSVKVSGVQVALHPPPREATLHPSVFALPGLVLTAFAVYSLRAQAMSEAAIDAALTGDWRTAARRFDAAAARDPALAFYWQASGFAYGMLAAEGDADALAAAIERTERGVELEPDYALHHANLAALYWQAGRREEALDEMRRAAEIAPAAGLFWLNAGVYNEAMGADAEAREDYRRALSARPDWADSGFWAESPLRLTALAEWRAGPANDLPMRNVTRLIQSARHKIVEGDLTAAERDLVAARQEDSQNSLLYLGFAELALARGQVAQADRYLQAAVWVQSQTNAEKVMPLLAWAELARAQGQTEPAVVRYRQVFDAVTQYTVYGWGTWGWNPYAWFVFQRRGLPLDVLPQLVRADFTPDLGRRLIALGELYEARGDDENALKVYRQLFALDPSLTEARHGVERLSR